MASGLSDLLVYEMDQEEDVRFFCSHLEINNHMIEELRAKIKKKKDK